MRSRLLICMSFLFFGCFAQAQLAAVGDLNGDGKADVVVTDGVQPRIGVFLNTGNGSLGPGIFLNVGSPASSVWLADFNGDGHLDILAVTSPKLQISFGDGKGGFAAPVAIPQSGIPAIGPTVVRCCSICRPASLDLCFMVARNGVWIFYGDDRYSRQKCQTLFGSFCQHRIASLGCELRRRKWLPA